MLVPLTLALAMSGSLWAAPALPRADPNVGPSESRPTRRLIVRTSAVDFEVLRAELRTRWPDAEVLPYGVAAFEQVGGSEFAYLEIIGERFGDAPVSITLVLSDGRAYLRRVVLSDASRARVLAVALSNLLGAVDDEDVPPDQVNVAVPTPTDVPEPLVEPPQPEVPTIGQPGPSSVPAPRPPAESDDDRLAHVRSESPLAAGPRWRIGVRGDLSLLLGLAPAGRRGRPTFGGGLALDARTPRGLGFGAGVRVVGDSALEYRMIRTRLAPWLGYIGRVGSLEFVVGAGPTVEPWRLRRDGRGRTLSSREGDSWTILYGAGLRAGLGWWTALRTAAPSSLRLGVAAELAASTQGSGKSVRVDAGQFGPELFTLGGVELALAAEAAWWFELRPHRAARAPRGSPRQ